MGNPKKYKEIYRHESPDWLQEFRENLVDESNSAEPCKIPKMVVMSPDGYYHKLRAKRSDYGDSTIFCLAVAEHQILGGKHFLILGPESGKIWWFKKRVQYLQKKYHCQ